MSKLLSALSKPFRSSRRGQAVDHPLVPPPTLDLQDFPITRLPLKALSRICAHLNEDSLFELARCSRAMNRSVFTEWQVRHPAVLPPQQSDSDKSVVGQVQLRVDVDAPPRLLTAIRCFLDFPAITSLTYTVSPKRDLRGVVQQIQGLTAIVWRQRDVAPIHEFTLDFSAVDGAIRMKGAEKFAYYYYLKRGEWREMLGDLLEAVARQGCTRLQVVGGNRMLDVLKGPTKAVPAYTPNALSAVHSPSEPGPPEDPSRRRNMAGQSTSLKHFNIQSDLLLSPLFVDWRSIFLNTNASRLTELKISGCTDAPAVSWTTLLSSVFLPNLRKLSISSITSPRKLRDFPQTSVGVDVEEFARFLARNGSKLEELSLDLYGIALRTYSPSRELLQTVLLPRLIWLCGPPVCVLWILSLPSYHAPLLEAITVTSEPLISHTTKAELAYSRYHYVLEALAGSLTPRSLVLTFECRETEGLLAWLQSHVRPGADEGGWLESDLPPLAQLVRKVHTLRFVYDPAHAVDREHVEALAAFVDAFPDVTALQLGGFVIDAGPDVEDLQLFREPGVHSKEIEALFMGWCSKLKNVSCDESISTSI